MQPLLDYLQRIGVVAVVEPAAASSGRDVVIEQFTGYLIGERGLAASTIGNYRAVAGRFLAGCRWESGALVGVSSESVNSFVLAEATGRSSGSLNTVATGLRALLRFLYLRHYISAPLVDAVPVAPSWRDRGVVRAVAADEVVRMLAGCDRRTGTGRRDFAILTVLARLGLRRGEVAALSVDDINWHTGELVVTGKGNHRELLPLPVDVGEAIADYCRDGRRNGGCRTLFLSSLAPWDGLSPSGIGQVVARACQRAGLAVIGAHRLRHTAATGMRAAGAPLFEIGQALRHRHVASTALYARDDLGCPARGRPPLAREWAMSRELRANVEEYLRIRRALGFKLEDHGRLLSAFIDHLERIGASTPTVEAALQWATAPQGVQPFRWKQRLSVVRGFARYLHGLDPAVPVPPSDLLVYRRRRPTPYVMSDTDITRLLSAASQRPRPLTAATYHTLFGLMAVTGMRVGEAVGLDVDDVDLDSGVIVIRETKHHKARRIPVQPTTVAALRRYSQLRQHLCPRPRVPCFFVSSRAGRITTRRARAMFARLVDHAGLQPRAGARPRVHDLRHSFAVATLLDWYRDGADVTARMPLLSAYLGHVGPASTYWYLQATPELLAVAAQWLEQHTGQRS